MIEAVNSVLSSAPLLRQSAEQRNSGATGNASAASESVQKVAQAPYISPFVSVDVNFDTAVILLRDSETGDTVQQIPSEGRLAAQRRDQAAREASAARAEQLDIPDAPAASTQTQSAPVAAQSDVGQRVTAAPVSSVQPSAPAAAPVATNAPTSTPISQAVLSAFSSGAQTAVTATTSFATSA